VRIFLIFLITFNAFTYGMCKILFVENSLEAINSCEGKTQLRLLKVWGGDETDDYNKFFKFPQALTISKEGIVYIADTMNHRIQVFNQEGKYLQTIGQKGQGPGDILEPSSIALDRNNNLIVCDAGNLRIQIFDINGKYLKSFRFRNKRPNAIDLTKKNEIALYSYEENSISSSLIYFLNYSGDIIREVGNFPTGGKMISESEGIFFTIDNNDNIFISFYATPYFQKFSPSGESLMIVTYDTLLKGPRVTIDKLGSPRIDKKGKFNINSGIAVDNEGRIYIISAERLPNEKEKFFVVGAKRFPQKFETDKTNRFRLLVFNASGKIIAAKRLSVFCDKIYIHKNDLFIIDAYIGMKIYEYKVSFNIDH